MRRNVFPGPAARLIAVRRQQERGTRAFCRADAELSYTECRCLCTSVTVAQAAPHAQQCFLRFSHTSKIRGRPNEISSLSFERLAKTHARSQLLVCGTTNKSSAFQKSSPLKHAMALTARSSYMEMEAWPRLSRGTSTCLYLSLEPPDYTHTRQSIRV
jgi:hypothetical protein